jgi:hypothetical protein
VVHGFDTLLEVHKNEKIFFNKKMLPIDDSANSDLEEVSLDNSPDFQ